MSKAQERIERMLAIAEHPNTAVEEAQTALLGARTVAGKAGLLGSYMGRITKIQANLDGVPEPVKVQVYDEQVVPRPKLERCRECQHVSGQHAAWCSIGGDPTFKPHPRPSARHQCVCGWTPGEGPHTRQRHATPTQPPAGFRRPEPTYTTTGAGFTATFRRNGFLFEDVIQQMQDFADAAERAAAAQRNLADPPPDGTD